LAILVGGLIRLAFFALVVVDLSLGAFTVLVASNRSARSFALNLSTARTEKTLAQRQWKGAQGLHGSL
jgi:hypothetical protein